MEDLITFEPTADKKTGIERRFSMFSQQDVLEYVIGCSPLDLPLYTKDDQITGLALRVHAHIPPESLGAWLALQKQGILMRRLDVGLACVRGKERGDYGDYTVMEGTAPVVAATLLDVAKAVERGKYKIHVEKGNGVYYIEDIALKGFNLTRVKRQSI